jgi:hypothetical protein
MAMNGTRLMEQLKEKALRMGTLGVRYVVEGTVTAVKVMDRLQELMPKQEHEVRVRREPARGASSKGRRQEEPTLARPIPARPVVGRPPEDVHTEARATAERVLEEAKAAQERLVKARPARRPLKVPAAEGLEETPGTPKRRATSRKTARTQGRKTTASATAPKRVTEPEQGFKAKRGQKLKH